MGALGTCLERQICRGGIGRQIFNKFLQKKIQKKIYQKKFFQKNFFKFFNFFFLQKLCTYSKEL